MRTKLANGQVDIVDDGLDNAVAMVLSGVDVVIVTGSRLADQELIATTGHQVGGKTCAVRLSLLTHLTPKPPYY